MHWLLIYFYFFKNFLCMVSVTLVSGQGPQVTIPGLGTVEGDTSESWVTKRTIYQFKGIPFATPPIGNLRFQPPEPVEAWSGVWNATQIGRQCPQKGFTPPFMKQSNAKPHALTDDLEDCLYIHVYTPTLNPDAKLPVLVSIHGGAFIMGSAQGMGSERLLEHDVIFVVPHYRLGPFGFLSLQTNSIPGNAGMLDQVASLQWVKDNIAVFGGDPEKITVMGGSAGAVSAGLLHISPLSTGLFQNYISSSGTAASDWAIDNNPIYAATEIGRLAGCTDPEVNALTLCLLGLDVDTFLTAYDTFKKNEGLAGRPDYSSGSGPVIQKAGAVRFLERHPREILNDGDYVPKPAILGANKHEGTLIYSFFYNDYFEPNDLLNNSTYFKRDVTNYLLSYFGISDQGEAVAAGVEKAYFGQENMGNLTAMTPGLIDYLGVLKFKSVNYEQAKYNAKTNSSTFEYAFRYLGDGSGCFNPVIPAGVCHGAEINFLFYGSFSQLSDEEEALSSSMTKLWANFATYGNPTPIESPVEGVPTWPLFDSMDTRYLRIDIPCTVQQDYTKNEYFVARDESFPWK